MTSADRIRETGPIAGPELECALPACQRLIAFALEVVDASQIDIDHRRPGDGVENVFAELAGLGELSGAALGLE